VECKSPDEITGITQLKTYLNLEPEARLGIWFNGTKHILVYKIPSGFVVDEHSRIPRPGDPLGPSAAHPPLKFADLTDPPNLGEVFSRLRDKIAAQDSHVNRDEFILKPVLLPGQPGRVFDPLVGVPAANEAARTAGLLRVAPGDPDHSYLLLKLEGTLAAGEGVPMPLVGGPLPASAIDTIRRWIAAGAPETAPF